MKTTLVRDVPLTSTSDSYLSGNKEHQFVLNTVHGVRMGTEEMDRGRFPSCLGVNKHVWHTVARPTYTINFIDFWVYSLISRMKCMYCLTQLYLMSELYTECNRRNGPNFGRVFLMLNYTGKTQNTYIQSRTVWEIMASEVWNFDSCYTLTDYQIHIETGRNMWFL